MGWTPTDAETATPIGIPIDVIDVDVGGAAGHGEAVE